jgi:hypothetical protein
VGGDEEGGVKSAFGLSLGLICVIVFKSVVAAQAATPAPVGVDGIMRVLTDQKRWTLYRDRADRVKDPARPQLGATTSDRSVSTTLEFMRVGPRLIGHEENDELHHMECEFEVDVRDDGVTFAGCTGSDKLLTYDPHDRDFPFRGRLDSVLFWLAPLR